MTSHSNTFANIMPGVNVTAVKADAVNSVTVSVERDVDAISNKIESMIKAANEAMSNVRDNSKWDPAKKAGGPFVGDSTTRELTTRLVGAFIGDVTQNASIAGISIDKAGVFTFDKAKFKEAFAKDSAAVESAVSATAKNVYDVSKSATNAATGTIAIRIQGEQSLLQSYSKQIAGFEEKMALREITITRKFQALESMMNKLKGQGAWLTGQLASLPTNQSK